MAGWNPWHGCHKLSAGCANCYVYRIDARHGRDSSVVEKTAAFSLPVRKDRKGRYKIPPTDPSELNLINFGIRRLRAPSVVYTCFSSDFFVEEADAWRKEAWEMMRTRSDLHFLMITKRIDRFGKCVPEDWSDGYPNITICCTVENQDRADYRLPIYADAPIKHKIIICEPLLGPVDLSHYLDRGIEMVVAGGESGPQARPCRYEWILELRRQCIDYGVAFNFRQTGARLIKDGRLYMVKRQYQHSQARRASIDYNP